MQPKNPRGIRILSTDHPDSDLEMKEPSIPNRPTSGSAMTESLHVPHAFVRKVLLQIGSRRSPNHALACDALFGLLDEAQAIRYRLGAQLEALGVSEGKFFTLAVLYGFEPEPSTPAALARHTGVTRASMTAVLDQMVKVGWVSRVRSQADRRQIIVRLTPKGIRMADRVINTVLSTSSEVAAELQARREATQVR
jgi:DNA-binding MarR family transcriptional regulator